MYYCLERMFTLVLALLDGTMAPFVRLRLPRSASVARPRSASLGIESLRASRTAVEASTHVLVFTC